MYMQSARLDIWKSPSRSCKTLLPTANTTPPPAGALDSCALRRSHELRRAGEQVGLLDLRGLAAGDVALVSWPGSAPLPRSTPGLRTPYSLLCVRVRRTEGAASVTFDTTDRPLRDA